MRKLLLSTVAFAALAGTAFAADLPSTKEAPVYVAPVPAFSWTGFYVGADIGGAFANTNVTSDITGFTSRGVDMSGIMGGGYAGYNYQLNQNFVIGLEGDFQGTSAQNNFSFVDAFGDAFSERHSLDWLASINGRIGVAYDRALFYAIGGGAWAGQNDSLTVLPAGGVVPVTFSNNNTLGGFDVGGGIEYAFTPNWVGRVEYRYYDFENQNLNLNTFAIGDYLRQRTEVNTVRVGLAYLFSAPAPVVAKY